MTHRAPRGFSLIELVIALTLSLVALTMGMSVAGHFQRHALMQEEVLATQAAGRAAADLIGQALSAAGTGLGAARLTTGATSASDVNASLVTRYAVDVDSNAVFSSDSAFALPPAPYDALTSDAVEIWKADTDTIVYLKYCPGLGFTREGQSHNMCASSSADVLVGKEVLVVNPDARTGCLKKITNSMETGGLFKVSSGPGQGRNPVPPKDPCEADDADFWKRKGTMLLPMSSVAFRVNWKSGTPALEVDPDGSSGPEPWKTAASNVERMKIRKGVLNLSNPRLPLTWFPDSAAGTPAIEDCTDSSCAIPGVVGFAATADNSVADELQRRLGVVEVTLTVRTARRNLDLVQANGSSFLTDSAGHFLDGYVRRDLTFHVGPRNYRFAGSSGGTP